MTLEETRNLGIEFERRIHTMIPEREILEKLDTETIYSFLNQYQDKYVHDIYRNLDNVKSGSKLSSHTESILQSMLKSEEISINAAGVSDNTDAAITIGTGAAAPIIDTGRSVTYPLDPSFYMYIRSVSQVSSTYAYKAAGASQTTVIPNELVSQADVWRLIETPHNSLRILRYPAAVLSEEVAGKPTLTVIYDRYTTPTGIRVLYYKQPKHFDLMTSTPCELPIDAFDDIVTGAVDLYVQYAAGAEANRKRQQEAAKQQQKEESKRKRNEDED